MEIQKVVVSDPHIYTCKLWTGEILGVETLRETK